MKYILKQTRLLLMSAFVATGMASCDDKLNLDPISQITPDDYYHTADQLANYLNNYYNTQLYNPFSGRMYHGSGGYSSGMGNSDKNTDLYSLQTANGLNEQREWFAKNHKQTPVGKALQSEFENIRVWNYFLGKANENLEAGTLSGDAQLINNYIGEGYFFRALAYYRLLAQYGDMPILTEVLEDNNDVIVEHSQRAPRNEVARFILSDLDKAISMLADRSYFKGQRVNKQTAALLKSRVALFEGTFEKYHRGSGRVPGDANWPGANMSYNANKNFNIDSEIDFFLSEAMNAAQAAVDNTPLTTNSMTLQPEVGVIEGWNPYFEMYGQLSLANVPEVLLWKEYNKTFGQNHPTPYYIRETNGDGMTRAFTEGFLMEDGKPFYASDLYQGDESVDNVKSNRDYRLQLFLWSESTLKTAQNPSPQDALYGVAPINNSILDQRNVSGYAARKYFSYHYPMTESADEMACPIFRTAEGMLNYIEACVEKTGAIDGIAANYWGQLRQRAGVNTDYNITVANTDLSQERQLSAYSGTNQVSALLFSVRRERMNELFNEGLRFADLIRWRSFDRMIQAPYALEGCNFWDSMWEADRFKNENNEFSLVCDGSPNALISGPDQGKYLKLNSASLEASNELRDGYVWTEAYYLYPLGAQDITSASPDRSPENSNMYQNIYWSSDAGKYAER